MNLKNALLHYSKRKGVLVKKRFGMPFCERITMKNEQDNLPMLYKDKFDNSAIKKIEF
jgi:hypothetical protein